MYSSLGREPESAEALLRELSSAETKAAETAPWVRNFVSEMRPGTIFEEYCDPVTGEFGLPDVVSHEPLCCKPSPPG